MDNDNGIFKDQGRPVKFFIQKDLAENVIDDLTVQITTNGGTVEDKVPLQGYVIVEPTSGEGKRLFACWSTADRPHRCFVPPTFVPACLQAGKLLPQPFRDRIRGERKRINIHSSITNEALIESLCTRIWNAGGDPTATELEADVIIAEEDNPVFPDLILRYDHTRHQFIESPGWVAECVESGIFRNTPSVKKNLGGRLKGSRRTEFTEVDDKHLAQYIASRLPDPTMRGRTGNKIYQDMCSRIDLYPWAERHPWQSWRERYKTNVQRFTHLIDSFVKLNPISPDGKGIYGFVRAASSVPAKSPSNSRKPASEASQVVVPASDSEWGGSQWEVRVGNTSPPAWGREKRKGEGSREGAEKRRKTYAESGSSAHGQPAGTQNSLTEKSDSQVSIRPLDTAITSEMMELQHPIDADDLLSLTRRQSPDGNIEKEKASPAATSSTQPDKEDLELGEQTQMLLTANQEMLAGTRSSWGSPKIEVATQELTNSLVHGSQLSEAKAKINATSDIAPKAPDIGQVLVQIARKYRFVIDEVKEIYEEQEGDLERTKAFFKEARQDLIEKRTTWKLIAGPVTREFEKSE